MAGNSVNRFGAHPLPFRGECLLVQDFVGVPALGIVYSLTAKPEQQRSFRRVADSAWLTALRNVQRRCGVHCDAVGDKTFIDAPELGFHHAHPVLCQRSGLVRADDGCRPEGLAGVKFPHQILLFQHLAHAQRKADRHAHRQPFRHRHDNKRHGDHQRVERGAENLDE